MSFAAVHGSEFSSVEYSSDQGSTWLKIPGIQSYSESGGEAPERDVVGFDGVAKRSGHLRIPTIEMSAVYSPVHAAWAALRDVALKGALLQFRLTTKKDDVDSQTGSTNTAAIATTGVVTFAGNEPEIEAAGVAPGQVLVVDSKNYVIDSISAAGVITVKPAPDSAIAAKENWKIILPSVRRTFAATVRLADRASLESEGDMTTTLTLAPRAQLPAWEIV